MSQFSDNLTKRRKELDLSINDIVVALNRRGVDVEFPTVAGWLNGSRGRRWKVDELRALLDVLQTDLNTMSGEGEFIEEPDRMAVMRAMDGMSNEQRQALLALAKTIRGK